MAQRLRMRTVIVLYVGVGALVSLSRLLPPTQLRGILSMMLTLENMTWTAGWTVALLRAKREHIEQGPWWAVAACWASLASIYFVGWRVTSSVPAMGFALPVELALVLGTFYVTYVRATSGNWTRLVWEASVRE